MEYCLAYLFVISAVSVFVCVIDKYNAIKNKWRISEKMLFLLSFLGGAVTMYLTMRLISHKTRHKRFMIGLPVIIFLQCAVFFCLQKLFDIF